MCGVNRRKNLQVLFRLGLCSLSPFPVLLNAGTGKENAYFPNYVDVASLAGLTAKTVVAGHESKDFLYRNNGDGTFTDVTRGSGLLQAEDHWNSGAAFLDYDRDGHLDLIVSNYVGYDSGLALYESDPSLVGVQSPVLYGPKGLQGSKNILYHNDGRLDILKTNFSDQTTSLYHNRGNGFFNDRTFQAGLSGQTSSVKWGTAFVDFDNDGQPDIFIATGGIYPPGLSGKRPKAKEEEGKKILYRNIGNGRFEDISEGSGAGLLLPRCSRGAAFGDIFRTGQIDVVINNLNDPPTLLRNLSPSVNSWLLVRLVGTHTNRAAVGSRVVLEAEGRQQIQEVRSGGSFCSQSDLRLHFGLGRAREASRVTVKWLGGGQETLERVPANRLVVIQEGKGIVEQEKF